MHKIALGKTDLLVSRIGLGTVKFGRNQQVKYPHAFDLPTDNELLDILSYTKEIGINLLDTAPAYGCSEERLGKALLNQRHHWVLSTKVGEEFIDGQSHFDFSKNHVSYSIERSLKRLKTDFLDIVLIHSNGEDKKIIDTGIFDTLNGLKKEGKIRVFGMSTKTIEGGKLAVDFSDVVMVTYNTIDKEEKAVIHYAHDKNKGVFIKKPLLSGNLQKIVDNDPIKKAIRFIFKEEGISSIIIGSINKEHLSYNVKCATDALTPKIKE